MYSVMLVDDEDMILRGLECLIGWEDYGLEIAATANDGEQAWALLSEKPCDILITDIRMPKADGIELLRRISEANLPTKAIVISGYDEFSYVKKALQYGIENYLLKPINEEELSATLLTAIEKLDTEQKNRRIRQYGVDTLLDNVISRWMTGTIEADELESRAELVGIDLASAWYTAVLLRAERDLYKAVPTLKAIVGEALGLTGRLYFSSSSANALMVLMMSDEKPSTDAMLEGLLRAVPDDFSVSVGASVCRAAEVPASYADAAQSLAWARLLSPSASEYLRHLPADEADTAMLNTAQQFSRQASQARKSGDPTARDMAFDALFDTLSTMAASSEPAARKLLFEVLPRLFDAEDSQYWQEHKIDLNPAQPLDADTLRNARDAIKAAAVDYDQHYQASDRTHPILEKIYQYVQEHYAEDISLKKLSGEMHFSPAYLGQLFKQHSGQLFLDYVCEFRIDKAKQLLTQTTYKSYDIAKMVGFRNANYFANVFQKMTGMYPTVYRRQALQG